MTFIDTGQIGDIIHDEEDESSEFVKDTFFTKVR
jgi:hypothetical protein